MNRRGMTRARPRSFNTIHRSAKSIQLFPPFTTRCPSMSAQTCVPSHNVDHQPAIAPTSSPLLWKSHIRSRHCCSLLFSWNGCINSDRVGAGQVYHPPSIIVFRRPTDLINATESAQIHKMSQTYKFFAQTVHVVFGDGGMRNGA